MLSLNSVVGIVVPSTEKDLTVPADVYNARVEAVSKHFSNLFGGATAVPAVGSWLEGSLLIEEDTTIVFSFCSSDQYNDHIDHIKALAAGLCIQWSQYCIGVLSYSAGTGLSFDLIEESSIERHKILAALVNHQDFS